MTVSEYLEANNYNPKHIVVELNEQILPKSEYFTTTIADGDVMEVLSFMGGGGSIQSTAFNMRLTNTIRISKTLYACDKIKQPFTQQYYMQ